MAKEIHKQIDNTIHVFEFQQLMCWDFTSANASTRVTDRRMAAQDGSIESRKRGSALNKTNNIQSQFC